MTRSDALRFLDLPEDTEDTQIAERYKEKYNFFKTLHTNAPNTVVRNLQQKNLEKLTEIKNLLKLDTILSSGKASKTTSTKKQSKEDEQVGWLVVHTEGLPIRSFGLVEGENAVGRSEVPNRNNIIIGKDEDPFVSRYHCVIIIAPARGQMAAAVADDGRFNKGKESVNGTYVNGNEARISMTRIKENDTIQVGVTKLVFKWNTASKEDMEDLVSRTDYIKTVVVDI